MDKAQTLNLIPKILITLLIAGGVWTYFVPLVRVSVPPAVSESWSAWDMTQSLPKGATKKESNWDAFKLDFDFMDVLVKILPKKDPESERSKFSLTFYMGILVPIMMVLSYVLLVITALLFAFDRRKTFFSTSVFGFGASLYSLFGVFYLGGAAQRAFQATVDRRAEGFLGAVTKHMVRKITIEPELALYVLCGCFFLICAVAFYQLSKKS